MRNKQIAMGLNIINDNIGFEKKLSINADYSYRIKLSETSNLSFGLKAGIVNYSNNLYQYKLFEQGNDPKFAGEIEQKVSPNFGVGVFFYQPAFYIGFSVPKLLENTFKSSENYFIADIEQRHYYLTGAYVFELVEGIVFKPSLLINTVVGAPVQANFSANFLVAGKVWIGALFRTNDACGVMVQWVVDNKIRIGYATDFSLTNLKSYNSGTHEIMFSIDFRAIKQRFIKPRYF
jgi:type IX secretion system PorP/SprF family membrane protein